MCGLTGFFGPADAGDEELCRVGRAMAEAIAHRGPDDGGFWSSAPDGLAFAHRRLSIIDLSAQGHQPMQSACGRYIIVYNGEIYNFLELRSELEAKGHTFRGHSDTEVIVQAWAEWGAKACLQRLIGMFAIAVWDRSSRTLTLARDRLGIKPLYWGRFGKTFLFGSELKALRAHPAFRASLNMDAVASMMRFSYVPGERSIYQGVSKLEPGTVLTVGAGRDDKIEHYWNIDGRPVGASLNLDDGEAVDHLDDLLGDAVERRMIADVPLGAFLSGGIDSSTVVALMQAKSKAPVKTFSIGFREKGYDEAQYARAVAEHLGTDHTELYVSPKETLAVIPKLADMFDEPFADPSQIPTYLVSELTRRHVTVSLSGDGGDELFGGYNRYMLADSLWRKLKPVPRSMRQIASRAIHSVPPGMWDTLSELLPFRQTNGRLGDKLHKLAGVIGAGDDDELYWAIVSHWLDPREILSNQAGSAPPINAAAIREHVPQLLNRMRYYDIKTYLPEDILTKVDRASMAVSLEARVPILDHRVTEFAWSLPADKLIRNGESKWILRQVLYRYVPKPLIERPKMGFGVPIDAWLRGPLREWAEELLSERRLKAHGIFDVGTVRRYWHEHLSGRRNWQYRLWNVLVFQGWHERWMEGSGE